MTDYAYAKAQSWQELFQVHATYVHDYRVQDHWAHRDREDGRRSPEEVLGWVKGREVPPAQLQEAFTVHLGRRMDRFGNVRVQRWKLYAEANLPRKPAELWFNADREALTIAFGDTPLVQYPVQYEAKTRQLTGVGLPLLFRTPFHSSQLPLWDLSEVEWKPARYREKEQGPKRQRKRRAAPPSILPLWEED